MHPDCPNCRAARAHREAEGIVTDAIHDALREEGYELPLQEQVGAVVSDLRAARELVRLMEEREDRLEAENAALRAKLDALVAAADEVRKEREFQKQTEMMDNATDQSRSRVREWRAMERLLRAALNEDQA